MSMKTQIPYIIIPLLVVSVSIAHCGKTTDSSSDGEPHEQSSADARGQTPPPSDAQSRFEDVREKYGVSPDVPDWTFSPWANSNPLTIDGLKGNVVVVRFWTNTCPYCARSMPALQRLKEEVEDRPVTFIGAYHSKPFGSERPWESAVEKTRNWNVSFPVAYDRNWTTLRNWWLSTGNRQASSCTFVLNKHGRVTYIHPGPVYEPGDPDENRAARDFQVLKQAIRHALARPGPEGTNNG